MAPPYRSTEGVCELALCPWHVLSILSCPEVTTVVAHPPNRLHLSQVISNVITYLPSVTFSLGPFRFFIYIYTFIECLLCAWLYTKHKGSYSEENRSGLIYHEYYSIEWKTDMNQIITQAYNYKLTTAKKEKYSLLWQHVTEGLI